LRRKAVVDVGGARLTSVGIRPAGP